MEQETTLEDIKKILARTAEITERNAKLIGDLGNKFGSFTEGMAFPSMEKVLRKQFGMTTITTNYKTEYGPDTLEIDVLGMANGDVNTVVLVEVKSHLKERDIDQLLKNLDRFRRFHPEYNNKKLYGILACVQGSTEVRKKAMDAGLYVASIHDEVFELKTPAYFVPQDFSLNMAA
ncbi:DUF3782 domain-containing protein [Spirosoma fluviale]|uniref:DUF8196 domain-containing protein n=1 Tax=Spirosoma fluviale TaxID=1597977 RepID=A0A286FIQ7_9BACT|nr:DUF3782 domain-containing protein [Spirosoma fluviale]SOD83103.1 hypothetical protein SAMN06269250_2364 [Spirosoma fluviale]